MAYGPSRLLRRRLGIQVPQRRLLKIGVPGCWKQFIMPLIVEMLVQCEGGDEVLLTPYILHASSLIRYPWSSYSICPPPLLDPPQSFPLLWHCHYAPASVAFIGLIAEFLIVALSGLPYRPAKNCMVPPRPAVCPSPWLIFTQVGKRHENLL